MPLSHTAELSHSVTSTTTAGLSSVRGPKKDAWKMLQSSETFSPYQMSPWPPPGCLLTKSRASRQGSCAKTSVVQAARWVFLETQDLVCGEKCSAWQGISPESSSSSSKTSQVSFPLGPKGSRQCCRGYRRQGSLSGGQLYHAGILEPVICVRDGSHCAISLPTPRVFDSHRPTTFASLGQRVCMSCSDDATAVLSKGQQLGHLNCHLSECIMGFPQDWTQVTDCDVAQ